MASTAKIGWWPKCSDALQGRTRTDSVPICSVARERERERTRVPMRVIGEMLLGKDGKRGERGAPPSFLHEGRQESTLLATCSRVRQICAKGVR